ncbi:class I SAM-dependent methyltransferase [Stella sp.]|uniref:class I SAM-dependent methyltransferase n=1 Tax=Stella sp. TaxID=2912054 RepID=UPI0035B27CEB
MTDPVRAQYETYPYPARDPKDERRRLVTGSPSHIAEVEHYLFAGRIPADRPLRVLFAGGGTGDGAIMLAQQLADRGLAAEVVHLDLSTAARRIAEARAAERGLTMRFVTGSLLEAAGLGRFDYIDCCGVLHHLDDPDAGLRALAATLAPGGGIGIMVYGELGRSGVYPMQDLLRGLAPPDLPPAERVALARRVVRGLPDTNLLRRNPLLGDHLSSDAGLFDLLLHARDRAYRVPGVLALLAGAGLRLVSFVEPIRYRPETWIADPAVRRRLAGLPAAERMAAAELLSCGMKVHIAYAVAADRADDPVCALDDAAVPVLRDIEAAALARALKPGQPLVVRFDGAPLSLSLPDLAGPIVARIDGHRTVAAIRDDLRRTVAPRLDGRTFAAAFQGVFEGLCGINRLLLSRRVP